jgi:hypothetical protein
MKKAHEFIIYENSLNIIFKVEVLGFENEQSSTAHRNLHKRMVSDDSRQHHAVKKSN